jgi:hypothetical protein
MYRHNQGTYATWGGASCPLYSSVTCHQRIYGYIFIGYTSPMNICLHCLVPMNIVYYIHRRCIAGRFCRLTDEYFIISYSGGTDGEWCRMEWVHGYDNCRSRSMGKLCDGKLLIFFSQSNTFLINLCTN